MYLLRLSITDESELACGNHLCRNSSPYIYWHKCEQLQVPKPIILIVSLFYQINIQYFRRKMFTFIGYHVNACRKFIHSGSLPSQIENSNLWIRHTSAEARFWIRLIFDIAITTSWTASHFTKLNYSFLVF
jgi:hypothetical protein